MSVDFYVAVPAAEWPSPASAQQCIGQNGYPITIERFPSLKPNEVVTDGALVTIDGQKSYLEGELSPASKAPDDVREINQRLTNAKADFRVTNEYALMSVRARSADEVRAAAYVISGLIICFHGYGFEPQGNGHGRADFAKGLLATEQQLRNQE